VTPPTVPPRPPPTFPSTALGEGPAGPELWGEHEQAKATRTVLGKPTPYVGREIELRMLEQAFDTCVEEPSSEVFLVTAQAGMGKSRLVHEFVRSIQRRSPEAAIWLGRADSIRAGAPLHLLRHALRSALGLQSGKPLAVQHEKLRSRLSRDAFRWVQRLARPRPYPA